MLNSRISDAPAIDSHPLPKMGPQEHWLQPFKFLTPSVRFPKIPGFDDPLQSLFTPGAECQILGNRHYCGDGFSVPLQDEGFLAEHFLFNGGALGCASFLK